MRRSLTKDLCLAATVAGVLALTAVQVLARSGGVTGRTLKTSTQGCSCHPGSSVAGTTTLKAPAALVINQTVQCTVLVGGSATGVDIAASSGTLNASVSGGRLVASNGELTHPSAGSGPYIFRYTAPSTAGTVTLYATGLSNNFDGPWGHAISATINVTTVATGVDEEKPLTYALDQNYPNPFNPSTTIAYSIPQSSRVTLEVFSLTGEKVATLVDGEVPAGAHKVLFSRQGLASGVYLYRLHAGNFVAARKFILMK